MGNNNPGVVLMLSKNIDFNKVVSNIKNDWNYEGKYEKLEQSNFTSYSFDYSNIDFVCSEFAAKYPEDIKSDMEDSVYGEDLEEIYTNHTGFWLISVENSTEKDLTKIYTHFTRLIMSMLRACEYALVYDVRSRLVIQADIYLRMYDKMQEWFQKDLNIFPVDWYVNLKIYENEGKMSAFTLGFEAFNGYEIELHNKELKYKEIINIMKFIIIKVISNKDKIKNGDIIPIPINGDYEEAIVKHFSSEILNKEALAIVF